MLFIVRIQDVIAITYKVCVNQLFELSVRLSVSGRLLISRQVLGKQKLCAHFRLHWSAVLIAVCRAEGEKVKVLS